MTVSLAECVAIVTLNLFMIIPFIRSRTIIALDRMQATFCPSRRQMGILVDNCRSMLGYLSFETV